MTWLARKIVHARSVANFYCRTQPLRFAFIFGHMRSGSTLLVHLLNAHRDVAAFGEAHMSYRTRRDFWLFHYRVFHALGKSESTERLLIDKILHNKYVVDDRYLSDPQFRFIFLVREPVSTMVSARRLFGGGRSFSTHEERFDYYMERHEALRTLAAKIAEFDERLGLADARRRSLFITYDDLINRTRPTLDAVGRHLGLEGPIPEEYRRPEVTKLPGFGDWRGKVEEGRIVREPSPSPADLREESMLREDELSQATSSYRESLEVLSSLCCTVQFDAKQKAESAA